jgi:hypothetical protein
LGLLLAAPTLLAQALLAQTAPAASPAAAATPTSTPTTNTHLRSHKTQKQLVLPPLPSGPLSQLPMDQLPPTPAKVSYQDGLLTISAQNSTLGEILRDVRKLTGASIDIPQGSAANERVVAQLGPGAPRDVLVGLLNGSSFNYVMLGSNSDPTAVTSVVLTAKSSSPGDTTTAPSVAANVYENNPMPPHPSGPPAPLPFRSAIFPQGGPAGNVQPAAADGDDKDDKDDDSADDADDQAQPGQPDGAQPQQQPDPNQQPNAGPSPEKILDLLRKQQPPGSAPPQPPQPPQ